MLVLPSLPLLFWNGKGKSRSLKDGMTQWQISLRHCHRHYIPWGHRWFMLDTVSKTAAYEQWLHSESGTPLFLTKISYPKSGDHHFLLMWGFNEITHFKIDCTRRKFTGPQRSGATFEIKPGPQKAAEGEVLPVLMVLKQDSIFYSNYHVALGKPENQGHFSPSSITKFKNDSKAHS